MNPDEFVYLGRPITYFLSNAHINLVDGNVVVNLLDYFPVLKSGISKYNTVENIVNIAYDFNNDIFNKAFESDIPAEYVDTNAGKIKWETAIDRKLIENPLNTYDMIEHDGKEYDLENILYYNVISNNVVSKYAVTKEEGINIENNLEQELSIFLSEIEELKVIPLGAFIKEAKIDNIQPLLNDSRIKLYIAIILNDINLAMEFLKEIDPRMNNHEAYHMAVRYGNPEMIELIKQNIIGRDWYERQMFNSVYGPYGVSNDIKNYYRYNYLG
jgi:hypothetical protein